MKPLVIHEEAASELRNAVDYYESKSKGLGLKFAGEVQICLRRIQHDPDVFSFHKLARNDAQRVAFPLLSFF